MSGSYSRRDQRALMYAHANEATTQRIGSISAPPLAGYKYRVDVYNVSADDAAALLIWLADAKKREAERLRLKKFERPRDQAQAAADAANWLSTP